MKKSSYATIGVFCLLAVSCITAKAQKDSSKFSIGFGLEGGIPTGNSNSSYKDIAGFTIRGSYHVGPGFVTLTSGALIWLPKTGIGLDTKASIDIPVKAGYKYMFSKPFFVMGEAGFSSFKIYYKDGNGKLTSTSSSGFTFAPTVGVNFKALELGIRYESTSLSGGSVSAVCFRLGFNF